ncbi:osteoclast-associated immunoglobulin-like receptor isoform X3 [Pelodiscus sinensis]|uniref:osteoclast-associated immunoglobulin-like receptor isoform X3 n=1 Tax=Pelodiscus sinensis TaxID=13735 RepID=UPI003F6BD242
MDQLSAPELTVNPPHRVFLPGESVSLPCSAPSTANVSRIQFFRNGQRIDVGELQRSQYNGSSLQLSRVSDSHNGEYSCEYWEIQSGREIPSERSRPIPIAVTAWPPAPELTMSSQHRIFLRGESVTLTCSAPRTAKVSGFWFFRDGRRISSRELQWSQYNVRSLQLSCVSDTEAGVYNCGYWETESGRRIPSERSQNFPIAVTDLPPQPELSMDPPSGAVSEGFSLNFICMAPRDARERRFHFYKDGIELVPGDLGSEISTVEPRSVNVSVLSIPRAGPNVTGEFTCGYEENVAGRWVLSPRSQVATVTGNFTVSAHDACLVLELVVGGSFFLINGLIFLVSYRLF